jgi:hypothetical protein
MYGGHAGIQTRILQSDDFDSRVLSALEGKLHKVCSIDAQDVRLLVFKQEVIEVHESRRA